MCIRSRSLFVLLAVLTSIVASAQNIPMKVQHPTSPTTEIDVKAILPEDFPNIDKAAFAKVHPASFVLTNLSNRAIVALSIEWSYTSEDGRTGQGFVKTSSLNTKSPAVLKPHARLFVGPKVFVSESSTSTPHIGQRLEALDGHLALRAANATQITATIDTIIFEDGELVGPNKSQYDAEIQSQKIAADQIASKVRSAQSQGQDPTPTLKQIAAATMESKSDFLGLWSSLYARQLLNAEDSSSFDARLAGMEQTPTPLKIFRKTQ